MQAPTLALAAPQPPAAPNYGRWQERDLKLQFEIRPGAKANNLVLVLPQDVAFPGSHEFVLAKQSGGAFEAAANAGRPKVSLSFESSSRALLKVRGGGSTKAGIWVAMNDYMLVRP